MDVWTAKEIDGRRYDLSHLRPITLLCEQSAPTSGVPPVLRISVRYSCHCFTTKFQEGKHSAAQLWMDHKRRRAFCEERYEWSKHLPEIVSTLPRSKVQQTFEQRNYVYFETALLPATYATYFSLKRSHTHGAHLHLMIESAYCVETPKATQGSVRFHVLAAKIFQGQKLKFRGR